MATQKYIFTPPGETLRKFYENRSPLSIITAIKGAGCNQITQDHMYSAHPLLIDTANRIGQPFKNMVFPGEIEETRQEETDIQLGNANVKKTASFTAK